MSKKFNNTLEMEKAFARLLKADFNQKSIGQVKRSLRGALGPLPEINWPMNQSWAVIRARVIDESVEDISKPATFGAPPEIETTQGRANIVNFPVFYGTFDSRNAMHELDVDLGTECYVSIWEFVRNTPTATTFLSAADKENDLSILQETMPQLPMAKLKGGYTQSSLKKGLELRAKAFTSGNYEFTSKIAHDIIHNRSAQSDGLIYPGVRDPYRCNIALNPKFVTENMRCALAYKMVWSGAFIFKILARATNEKDVMVWKPTGSYEMDERDYKYTGSNGPPKHSSIGNESLSSREGCFLGFRRRPVPHSGHKSISKQIRVHSQPNSKQMRSTSVIAQTRGAGTAHHVDYLYNPCSLISANV